MHLWNGDHLDIQPSQHPSMLEEWWKTFGEEEVHEKEYASSIEVSF
jgi:hypothetical protein